MTMLSVICLKPSEKNLKLQLQRFYEAATQTPDVHLQIFKQIFSSLMGSEGKRARKLQVLREDFCGSFLIASHFVKSHPDVTAHAIDASQETLELGKMLRRKHLTPSQRRRLHLHLEDVRKVRLKGVDLAVAGNFSFNIFKSRSALKAYFKNVRSSLRRPGGLVLEVAVGPGMTRLGQESKTVKTNRGKPWFKYIWDQKKFNPLTADAEYRIHFREPSGRVFRDAFVYDWRLWTVPEIRELLREAGFDETYVYSEVTDDRGEPTGIYLPIEEGQMSGLSRGQKHERSQNADAWIYFVLGVVR